MPLRQFRADLAAAAARLPGTSGSRITSITKGDSDGELVFTYTHETLVGPFRVQALAQDADGYPDMNSFFIFTESDNPPACLLSAMAKLQDFSAGWRIQEMVSALTKAFDEALEPSSRPSVSRDDDDDDDVVMTDVEDDVSDDGFDDGGEEEDEYEDDDFGDELFGLSSNRDSTSHGPALSAAATKAVRKQIRRDLREVKNSGFKFGVLCGMEPSASTSIASFSVRASKLGLSEGVLKTWDISTSEYIVLLYRIDGPYRSFEQAIELPAVHTGLSFCIGKCSNYKPGLHEALAAFSESNRTNPDTISAFQEVTESSNNPSGHKFAKIIVSKSLNQFMNDSFISLMKLRQQRGISWDDANILLLDHVGLLDRNFSEAQLNSPKAAPDPQDELLPAILNHDHLAEGENGERSMPLIAIQFAMRYFTKCTKYCLNCHRKVEDGLETLKPYVCSNPLCLFQYMAMGFGPSIEHEILSQPRVVDLLVSFCYAAIQPGGYSRPHGIREFPVGLQLKVPDTINSGVGAPGLLNGDNTRFLLDKIEDLDRLGVGQWVAFRDLLVVAPSDPATRQTVAPAHGSFYGPAAAADQRPPLYHGKVKSLDFATQTIEVDMMAESGGITNRTGGTSISFGTSIGLRNVTSQHERRAELLFYSADFDSLDVSHKTAALSYVLDTLPQISKIKDFLISHPNVPIRKFHEVSPAAAALLEWIVSSNRSCIFQTGQPEDVQSMNPDTSTIEYDQVLGMQHWVQFRFAQGSPDSELRFNQALQAVVARKHLQHQTLFAWHGSALSNWHSIVRTGLDFKNTINGRAFGNGVYFSPDFNTSIGYTAPQVQWGVWPNSDLRVQCAISLNEVINAPDEYQSSRPHYVVAQEDWHQCRMLFVQTAASTNMATYGTGPMTPNLRPPPIRQYFEQDPNRLIKGPKGTALQIPLIAMPWSRIGYQGPVFRASRPGLMDGAGDGDGDDDDEEDAHDIEFLFSDDDEDEQPPVKHRSYSRSSSVDTATARQVTTKRPLTPAPLNHNVTEFHPGSLDLSVLPRLQPPSWATSSALKSVSVEIKRLQALQANTPIQELGWFIDFDKLENVFQWIVELHSFELTLPLAQDMKKANVASIVCEIRFGANFPFNPPFVRIIRPRFLPFMSGGGGHVTMGGAMCMELLTTSGWSPANSIESVLLQIRLALCSLDPKPARLDRSQLGGRVADYGISEAVDAYVRAAHTHGWKVPDDLQQTAHGDAMGGPVGGAVGGFQ